MFVGQKLDRGEAWSAMWLVLLCEVPGAGAGQLALSLGSIDPSAGGRLSAGRGVLCPRLVNECLSNYSTTP